MAANSLYAVWLGRFYRHVFSPCYSVLLRMRGVEVGSDVVFYGLPIVSLSPGSRIVIGDRVVVCSHSLFTALGVAKPVIFRTLRPKAVIHVGCDVGLSGNTICSSISVTLGERTLCGSGATIVDTDFHPLAPLGRRFADESCAKAGAVSVGADCFLGAHSFLSKSSLLGSGCVVGAHSFVVGSFVDNKVIAGVPARVVGDC